MTDMNDTTTTFREDVLPPASQASMFGSPSVADADQSVPVASAGPEGQVGSQTVMHLDLVRLIERMHRRYLDLLRIDLSKLGADDLSPAQVMMLCTIGTSELSVRDLIERGYYLGSNASYSLKRLVEAGYVERTTLERDRRSARLRLSDKGAELCRLVRAVDESYHQRVVQDQDQAHDFNVTYQTLVRLEQEWTKVVRYGSAIDP